MRIGRAVTGGLGALALGSTLAACGGGGFADESAETITTEAEDAMSSLTSVRMAGELTSDGQQLGLDVALNTDGDCTGNVELLDEDDASVELLTVDDQTWLRPSEGFWTLFAGPAADQVIEAAGDKWVVLPEDQADSFGDVCDLDTLLEEFSDGEDDANAEVGETEEVGGEEAVLVSSETEEGDPITAAVATGDPHYVLRLEVEEGEEPGTIEFSDFDEELDISAPSDDEVFDLTQLGATG